MNDKYSYSSIKYRRIHLDLSENSDIFKIIYCSSRYSLDTTYDYQINWNASLYFCKHGYWDVNLNDQEEIDK